MPLYDPSTTPSERIAAVVRTAQVTVRLAIGALLAVLWCGLIAAHRHPGAWYPLEFGAALGATACGVLVMIFNPMLRRLRREIAHTEVERSHFSRLAEVARRTSNAVVVTDAAERIEWINDGFTRMTGYSLEESLGHTPAALLQRADADPVERGRVRAALARGESVVAELVNYHKLGWSFLVRMEIEPLHDAAGLTGFMAIEMDVTAARAAERLLRDRTDRLELALTVANLGWTDRDVVADEIHMDARTRRLLGLDDTCASMSGAALLQLYHPDDRAEFRRSIELLCRGGAREHRQILRMRRADGSCRHIDIARLVAARDSAGAALRIISTYADITDLTEARERAEAAARTKNEFLANMSHEIRTPLNGVLGMTELLESTVLEGEQRQYLRLLQSSASMLLALVNDILDFSKIEAGKIELESLLFDPRETVAQVVDVLTMQARGRALDVTFWFEPDVPEMLRGDAGRLRQILLNLGSNAVKFTQQGSVAISVAATPIGDGEVGLHCSVADTGIGIAPEDVARLFTPFTQADSSTTRRYGGTGLGLSISRELVRLMRGQIGVDSQPGRGSRFWFTVVLGRNLQPAAAPLAALAPASAPDAAIPAGPERRSVLVVEDNSVNQLLAKKLLERLGYRTDLATDGAEAIAALRRVPYDVVLMDCQMPVMDGFEATRRIRDADTGVLDVDVPIIAFTANAMPEDRARCLAAGMTDYVSKPVSLKELAAALDRALGKDAPAAFQQPGR